MKHLKKYLKPYRKEFILGPAFKLLEAVLELTLPFFMAKIIDNGIAKGDTGYILRTGAVMLLIVIVGLASAIVCQYSASVASQGFGTAVRSSLFRHMQRLPSGVIDRFGSDTLTTRVTNDVTQVQTAVAMIIRLLIRAPFVSLGCIAAAMLVDVKLSVVMLVAVPLFTLVLVLVMVKSSPLYTKVQQKLDRLAGVLRENLSGVRVIRAFARTKSERDRVQTAADNVADATVRVGAVASLLNPLTTLIMNGAILFIVWFGGVRVNAGGMTQGEIVAFISYVTQVLAALIAVANLVVILTKAYASLGRINEVYAVAEEEGGCEPVQEVPDAPAVEFRSVTFSYTDEGDPELVNLSFCLPRGGSLGVIGGTGAGKSTLANLIIRLYDAGQGSVLVNGVDVARYPLEQLRQKIGFVQQGAELFTGTIADNIRWGCQDAPLDRVQKAAETAQAAEFIDRMPHGYQTLLGKGGKGLSGGQRQRVAIARALVREPQILILDDAASALDFATDAKLRTALKNRQGDTAVITISQRASAIRHCDQILVLKEGEAAGLGSHEELMQSCEEYREIVLSQLEEGEEPQ